MKNDELEEQAAVLAKLSEHLQPLPATDTSLVSLEKNLASRIHQSIIKHGGLLTVRARDGVWRNLVAGIRYKTLWQSQFGNSVLIEFAPGAALPLHRHNHLEEGIVLAGSLQVDDLSLQPFDYHISPAGSHHGKIWSKDGGLAYLRGSSVGETFAMLKEVLSGLLPKNDEISTTLKSNESDWLEIIDGVSHKILWRDGDIISRFIRLPANTKIAKQHPATDEEYMMLSGDIFLGDILLQAGDYLLAPQGTEHHDIYTDTGALLFVRGATQ